MPLDELVVYELHVGTFTEAGTFDAVIEHLAGLAELGVTAVELLPVADFPGRRGWGYDGVYFWAAHEAYGGPDALQRLVDAAHAAGIGVLLDLVLNHVGASGEKAIRAFGPYFTDTYSTFWGEAINYDGAWSRPGAGVGDPGGEMWVRDCTSTACASTPSTRSSTSRPSTSSPSWRAASTRWRRARW